jgi:hypothetical protein
MTVITNQLLKAWSSDKDLMDFFIAFEREAPEFKDIDEKMLIEAGNNFIKLCAENVGFKKLWNELARHEDTKILTQIALTHYYANKALELRKVIENQIKECKKFLDSDMCKRNLSLANSVQNELRKLIPAFQNDHMNDIVSAFDELLKRGKKKMSMRQRYIQISEILHYLKLEENKSFLTLKEAEKIVDDKLALDPEYTQTPERLVSDRIKEILKRKKLTGRFSNGEKFDGKISPFRFV